MTSLHPPQAPTSSYCQHLFGLAQHKDLKRGKHFAKTKNDLTTATLGPWEVTAPDQEIILHTQ